jgi:PIN domain nuclease of toxin-antitoxin system
MILLDTHALVWWVGEPDKLSHKASATVAKALGDGGVLVSSFSVWEIFMLVRKKRLKLGVEINDWIRKVERLSYLRFVPVDNRIAIRAVDLPGKFHGDPADRIIVASAQETGSVLVTKDKEILAYSGVETVW